MMTADTSDMWLKILADTKEFVIRSLEDFDAVVSGRTQVKNNPFAKLSSDVIAEFRKQLTFKNNGLAHAEYGMLKKALDEEEFYNVWALFGISKKLFTDYQDRYCSTGEHTCYYRYQSICTSNC